MDAFANALDLLGFVLLVVSGSAVFLMALNWRSQATRKPLGLGLSLVLFFACSSLMLDWLLRFAPGLQPLRTALGQGLGTLAWLSAAFSVNAALTRFVWHGALVRDGQPAVPKVLTDFVRFLIYAVALLVISSAVFGRDITAIAATSGVVAFVIGYSAQSTLAEIFAGIALNLSRPFRKGDSIQVDNIWGTVLEAGWRSVSIRAYEGNLIVLPNTKAASMRLINLDLPTNDTRHHIPFVMDIGVPPAVVREAAMKAMLECPCVLHNPPPLVLIKNFTKWGVAYEAIFWHNNPNVWILRRDEVAGALWHAFDRAGLPLAVRRRETALPHAAFPPVPKPEPEVVQAEIFSTLRRSALFAALPEDIVAELARDARRVVYGWPERIVRQGEAGSSMFVVLRGHVDVFIDREGDAGELRTATLGAGDTFGQMSLMTGEPRSATVRAAGDVVVAEIRKESLAPLLQKHPDLVDSIAGQIVAINAQNAERRRAVAGPETHEEEPASLVSRLAASIRGFFGG
ncbi:MAG TPA: mechanosensitive ion channel family protein [Alphaproteobacteria bacterium]|nr:mechanosensitive ion channel family protein [Alphaproteobacteria bacterium]